MAFAALLGPLLGLGSAYLGYKGAKDQASAQEANSQQAYDLQKEQQDYYKSIVQPGIDAAQQAFNSGATPQIVDPQNKAAGFASGLGQYYSEQAVPEHQRGRRLEDASITQAAQRAGITPESYAREHMGLAQQYQNPYTQQVTNAGLSAIGSDYDRRAQDLAGNLIGSGQLASTIAGQRQAAVEGSRTQAIGDYASQQAEKNYNQAQAQAQAAQAAGYNLSGQAGTQLGNFGQAAIGRGQDFGQSAVNMGETATKLGLGTLYDPTKAYLGAVQNPTAATPTITQGPQKSGVNPLTYGAGIGLQTYFDYQKGLGG